MLIREIVYPITEQDKGGHILDFLKSRGYSHSVITHLKRTKEGLLLNGKWARTHDPIVPGDTVAVRIYEENSSENIVPAKLPLSIIYEDPDLLIINKAAGMPIHPSQGNYDNTLANALAWYFKEKGEPFTYRCMNRLDRDTSGLLIVARHMLSACVLSSMAARREIHREYLAAAEGLTPEKGTVTAPISRKPGSTIERMTDENGEYARTHFTRLDYKNGCSLVSLVLDTGRTHQIRVHMKSIGHPLPGDFLYNPDYRLIQRQALHSWKLAFSHPVTGEAMSFETPMPEDMADIWN